MSRSLPLELQKPTLLLDSRRAVRNIAAMASKARESGVRFRPHFKTHRSARIGEWYREVGVEAITVSSADMARYFAQHGWNDITLAFPLNLREMDKIDRLASEIRLGVLVESTEVVEHVGQNLESSAEVWIKIDVGYGRTGIPWDRAGAAVGLAKAVAGSSNLTFRGLLTHAGHSYHAASKEEVVSIYRDSVKRMLLVRESLEAEGFTGVVVCVGVKPTSTIVDDHSHVD